MPRTQLHSAASGLARTRFHAHRGVRVEELKVELAQANNVVTATIKDDVVQTKTALTDSIEAARAGLSTQVTTATSEIKDDVAQTKTALTDSIEAARAGLSTQVTTATSEIKDDVAQTKTALTDSIEAARAGLSTQVTTATSEIKDDVAQTKTALTDSIEAARAGLSTQVTTATSEIKDDVTQTKTALTDSIEAARAGLSRQIRSVKRDTRHIPRPVIDRAELTSEQQTQVFGCMRILNQVESLTTDESRDATQKKRALGRIRNDTPLQSGLNTLPEVLQERARAVQNDFSSSPDDEARERLERFWEIQDLRQDIIAHFAAQQPVAPGSTPPADEPATQDTQS